ncbi:Fatty-acid amide hydrolase 2 [Halotydeus destructor]|nr:Fatty-acid amide hydrolase 2 [Halotydeus destructor]
MTSFENGAKRFVRFILDYLASLVGYFVETKRGLFILPPIEDNILLESATSLVKKIKKGEYKSEVVVKAFIERIKAVDGYVNAVVHRRFEEAILEAREIDRKIADELEKGSVDGSDSVLALPLLGVPFTGKDTMAVEGLYLTAGLFWRKGMVATKDCDVVANLKKAGAICLGITNCPELAFWFDSDNTLYGRTNNPYDLSRIPGGSTGGNGACISYAGSVIGTGGDIGGSIRLPCFFNGIFGHKPTPGICSTVGHYPEIYEDRLKYLSFGPMCRYACDLSPMFQVMAGSEAIQRLVPGVTSLENIDFSSLKVYYMEGTGDPMTSPVDKEIKTAIKEIAKHFNSTYGTATATADLKEFNDAFDIFLYTYMNPKAPPLESGMAAPGTEVNLYLELLKCIFRVSNNTLPVVLVAIIERLTLKTHQEKSPPFIQLGEQLKSNLYKLLGKDGVLLFPTQPEVAPKHKTTILKMQNTCYTSIFNLLEVPITQCPLGLNKDGLPIGVQVVASPFNDHLTLAVAQELERKFGGWVAPCRLDSKLKSK